MVRLRGNPQTCRDRRPDCPFKCRLRVFGGGSKPPPYDRLNGSANIRRCANATFPRRPVGTGVRDCPFKCRLRIFGGGSKPPPYNRLIDICGHLAQKHKHTHLTFRISLDNFPFLCYNKLLQQISNPSSSGYDGQTT